MIIPHEENGIWVVPLGAMTLRVDTSEQAYELARDIEAAIEIEQRASIVDALLEFSVVMRDWARDNPGDSSAFLSVAEEAVRRANLYRDGTCPVRPEIVEIIPDDEGEEWKEAR